MELKDFENDILLKRFQYLIEDYPNKMLKINWDYLKDLVECYNEILNRMKK